MTDEPNPIRLLVVDDHPAVREGLALLVASEGMEVCGEAARREDALRKAEECRPDLAVVDLSLDGEDGLHLVSDLREVGIPTLVYSMHNDAGHVQGAFRAGALGYVTKSEFRGVLVEAIRAVCAGQRFVSPKSAAAPAAPDPALSSDRIAALSGKEREVYALMGRGEGTGEIAAALDISPHTVESYYGRIQLKLGLEGMYELRRSAIDHLQRQSG